MPLLIDGLNLIYKFPELEEKMYYQQLDAAREGLLDILKEYQKLKKTSIGIVFDGKKGPSIEIRNEKSGSLDIYYSLDYSADFLIKQFVKNDSNPKMISVVTSDKDIISFIKRFGARNITSEKFAEHVKETFKEHIEEQEKKRISEAKENPSVSDDELSYWHEIFTSGKKKRE